MCAIVTVDIARFVSYRVIADFPPSLETIRATCLSIAPEGYAACCAAISAVDLLDRLASLRQPVLVINGSRDVATPPAEHRDRIPTAVPNARTAVLEAGQTTAVEEPPAFAPAGRTFLRRAAARGPRPHPAPP